MPGRIEEAGIAAGRADRIGNLAPCLSLAAEEWRYVN
jgi:hypothetical protein